MSYISEFPDYDGEFYVPKGWEDNSWHNDTMPRAMLELVNVGFHYALCNRNLYEKKEDNVIRFSLWQDYVDINKREIEDGKRYCFQIDIDSELIFSYETDDLEMVKELVKGVQNP